MHISYKLCVDGISCLNLFRGFARYAPFFGILPLMPSSAPMSAAPRPTLDTPKDKPPGRTPEVCLRL